MDIHDLEHIESWEWPAEASGEILRVLRDKGAGIEDRALAVMLAGDFVVINDELAQELLAILTDPSQPAEVRANAAMAFAPALEHSDCCDWEDEDEDIIISEDMFNRIRQTLREAYEDEEAPIEVRRRALESAVNAPEEWQREAVLAACRRDDPLWRATGVFGMGNVGGFDSEILDALKDPAPEVRFEALRAAGAREIEEAWPYVEEVLKSPEDRHLLMAAIEAAPYVNLEEARDYLAQYVVSDDVEISEVAVDATNVARGIFQFGEGDTEDYEEGDYEDDEDEYLDEEDDEN